MSVADIDMEETPPVTEAFVCEAFITEVIELSSDLSGASGLRASLPSKKRCKDLGSTSASNLPQAKMMLEPLPLPQVGFHSSIPDKLSSRPREEEALTFPPPGSPIH